MERRRIRRDIANIGFKTTRAREGWWSASMGSRCLSRLASLGSCLEATLLTF